MYVISNDQSLLMFRRLSKLVFNFRYRTTSSAPKEWSLAGFHGNCRILRVIDGDTLEVGIIKDLRRVRLRLRIMGVDTPETRTRNPVEKRCGIYVKRIVQERLVDTTTRIIISDHDKYGRAVGDVLVSSDMWMSTWLLCNNYAIPYTGGKREFKEEDYTKLFMILDQNSSV